MTSFLFWNLNGQPLAEYVAQVCAERNIDVLVLAECEIPPVDLCDQLRRATGNSYSVTESASLDGSERTIQGRAWQPLYNPFWSRLGDRTPGPAGTFFRRDASVVCFDWHLFDQVLFARGLLPYLENAGEVVDRIGEVNLTTTHGRLSDGFSDHLPIMFSLTDRQPKEENIS